MTNIRKTKNIKKSGSGDARKKFIIHIAGILIVIASAFIVRTPSAVMTDLESGIREMYMDENGLPYFTDMDSYYHARLVDDYMKNGYLGDAVSDDGKPWDTRFRTRSENKKISFNCEFTGF